MPTSVGSSGSRQLAHSPTLHSCSTGTGHAFFHTTKPSASTEMVNTSVCDRSISATTLSVSHRAVPGTAGGWSRLRCTASAATVAHTRSETRSRSTTTPLSQFLQPCTTSAGAPEVLPRPAQQAVPTLEHAYLLDVTVWTDEDRDAGGVDQFTQLYNNLYSEVAVVCWKQDRRLSDR